MVKKMKDKNAPKRAVSGFILFGNDLRANDENIKILPVTQQAAAIAKLWREIDEDKKMEYNKRSEELKAQYQKDLGEYEKTEDYANFQKALIESKNGSKLKKRRGNTKMSGYRLFVKENKEAIDNGLAEEDIGKKYIAKCGILWKSLDEKAKEAYKERAEKMNSDKATGSAEDIPEAE